MKVDIEASIMDLQLEMQRAQEQINKIWKALADDYGQENAEWVEMERRAEELETEIKGVNNMREFDKIGILQHMHTTHIRLTAIEAKLDIGE